MRVQSQHREHGSFSVVESVLTSLSYPLRENSLAAGDHRHARVALLCEAGDRPRMETPAAPECRYELGSDDLFLEQEVNDFTSYSIYVIQILRHFTFSQ